MFEKTLGVARKYGAVIAATPLALVGNAYAALPAAVSTAITTAETDMTTAVGLVIAAMVVVWGLKKLGTKMGWF